jgi:hypothetical protein
MNIKTLFAVSAMALAGVGAQASTNLVQNGSFEDFSVCTKGKNPTCTSTLADGTYTILNDKQLTGWKAEDNGVELRNHMAGSAQSGNYFIELDTTKNSSISQKVNITGPGSYLLSFWYAARPDNEGRLSTTDQIGWSFGDGSKAASGSVLQDYTLNGSTVWTHFTQEFTFKKQGSVDLTFTAKGVSDSYGGSLDNVSVTRMAAPVPEPESYAMLLAGLGLMGAIARRRQQRKV